MSSFLLQYTVGCRCWGDSVPAYGLLCKVKFSVWTWVSDWTGCCCFFQCLRSISERYWCWASAPTITLKETTHPCCHNSRWRWSALSSSAIYVVTLSISSGYFAAVFSPALYRFWLHTSFLLVTFCVLCGIFMENLDTFYTFYEILLCLLILHCQCLAVMGVYSALWWPYTVCFVILI